MRLLIIISVLFSQFIFADEKSNIENSAKNGDIRSQFLMGLMYDTGKGVSQDKKIAAGWYLQAAEQGSAGAQNNLALLYANGYGVERDYVLAHMWANLAIGNGIEEALELIVSLEGDMTEDQIQEARDRLHKRISSRSLLDY